MMRRWFSRGYAALPILLATAVVVTTGAIAASLITGSDQLTLQNRQENASGRVQQAMMGFVLANHRLPCPDTDDDGFENCPSGGSPEQRAGLVPYRTLGISGRQALSLAYVPMMGDDPDYNLTDSSDPPGDVVRIALPDEIPEVNLTFDDPDIPEIPEAPEDPEGARALLQALQDYDNFWSDLLVNQATDITGLIAVPTRWGSSWIGYYQNRLGVSIPISDGDEHGLRFPNDTGSNDSLYERTQEFLAWLQMRRIITTAKNATFDDVIDIQILQSDMVNVISNTALTDAAKVTEIGNIRTQWQNLLATHNAAVSTYNAANQISFPTGVSVSTNDLVVVSYDGGLDINSTDLPALIEAMSEALTETSNEIQSNAQDLGTALGNAASYMENEITGLISSYWSAYLNAVNKVNFYQTLISQTGGVCDNASGNTNYDAGVCADYNTYLVEYQNARDFYYLPTDPSGLWYRTGQLYDDFFCRATDDGDCVADGVQQAYLDRIEALSPEADPEYADAQPDLENPDSYDDPEEQDPDIQDLPPRETVAVNYPVYSNLADTCHKLQGITANPGANATIRYQDTPVNGVPAFLLIEYGRNLRLDAPNRLADNAGVFASPMRAHDLEYDDRVRPMTAERMGIALGCDALLQSYRSFANVAVEIDLLYQVAADTLDGAIQDIITNSINVALGVARLAVDTAAIIKDSAAGAAATAACVASLGLATNFCIAAGFNFSAAVAHAATLVGDAAALAASIAELVASVEGRDDALATLESTVSHYGDVVTEALLADCRGGVLEAGSVGLGSAICQLNP